MDKLILFLNIIAWIFGILSTAYSCFLTYWALTYKNSNEELLDKIQGYKKSFSIIVPLIVAIVCWSFVISF